MNTQITIRTVTTNFSCVMQGETNLGYINEAGPHTFRAMRSAEAAGTSVNDDSMVKTFGSYDEAQAFVVGA